MLTIRETERECPKCEEHTAYQVQGALYFTCESCDYAWVPE
jgi:predicted  nucleic acid-binding Zn ribbon protein